MNIAQRRKKLEPMWQYVFFSYLLFGIMVLGICGVASMVFGASPLTMRWLANLCAWSPTFVLLLIFPKLRLGMTRREFYYKAFHERLEIRFIIIPAVTVIGGIIVSLWILSLWQGKSFYSYFSPGLHSLPLTLFLSLLSGPTGEESGWRGYLRVELERRFGFLKGALALGMIWAFWHSVLWFVDSNFNGWQLIPYVMANVVVMTALTIIMNVVLKRRDNLFYAVWIHFCFNLLYGFLVVDIWFYIILSLIYAVIGAGYLVWIRKAERTEHENGKKTPRTKNRNSRCG